MTDTSHILNYLWDKSLSGQPYRSTSNDTITVVSAGMPHPEDQTLYCNAQLTINGAIHKGCVKIVDDAMGWKLWSSPLKESTIAVISGSDKEPIVSITGTPLCIISPKIPDELRHRFYELRYYKEQLCGQLLSEFDPIERERLWACLMIDRITFKCENIAILHQETGMSWSDTALFLVFDTIDVSNKRNRELYKKLFRSIGYGSIIRNIVSHSTSEQSREENLKNLEALLLGTAGMLSRIRQEPITPDSYTYELREKFNLLKSRYSISVMNPELWSFGNAGKGTLLPLQLARIAALIVDNPTLHYDIVSAENLDQLRAIFAPKPSRYWNTHIGLSREDTEGDRGFSKLKTDIFIINFIVPYLFFYNQASEESYNDTLCDTLLSYMNAIDAEKNILTNRWSPYVAIDNAFVGQAIIHLSKLYCDKGECTQCPIGKKQFSKITIY